MSDPNNPTQKVPEGQGGPTAGQDAPQPQTKPQDQGADQKTSTSGTQIDDETWQAAVSAWIDSHVRNSPIAGNAEAWNHLNAALPHLKELLEKGVPKSG